MDEDEKTVPEQIAEYGSPWGWLRVASIVAYGTKELLNSLLATVTYVDDLIDAEIIHRQHTRQLAVQMKQELEAIQRTVGGN